MDTSTGEVSTDELRRDIEARRDDIGRDLNVIGDRVSPGRIADRSRERTRQRVVTMRHRVMGSVDDAKTKIGDGASGIGDAPSSGFDAVNEKVKGSPLGMGLVAFGIGFVAGAVFPASSKEQELAHKIEPQLEGAVHEAADAARKGAEHVAPAAREEVEGMKADAQQAAEKVKGEATNSS